MAVTAMMRMRGMATSGDGDDGDGDCDGREVLEFQSGFVDPSSCRYGFVIKAGLD